MFLMTPFALLQIDFFVHLDKKKKKVSFAFSFLNLLSNQRIFFNTHKKRKAHTEKETSNKNKSVRTWLVSTPDE